MRVSPSQSISRAPSGAPPPSVGFSNSLKIKRKIDTGGAKPIFQRPYKIPYHLRSIVEQQVKELEDKGIISPSVSPWSAPSVLVKKKTSSGEIKYR